LKPLDALNLLAELKKQSHERQAMLVLGMMSGTSADGIDVALARISGAPPNLNAKLLDHTSVKFPSALRKKILRVAETAPHHCGRSQPVEFRLENSSAALP